MIWLLLYWYNILYSGIFVYKPFSHNKVFQVCLCLVALPSAVILWFFKVSYMLDRTSLRLLISLRVALRVFSASSVIHDFDYFSLQQSFKWYLVKRGVQFQISYHYHVDSATYVQSDTESPGFCY